MVFDLSLVPFIGHSFEQEADNDQPAPSEINPLPDGQSQIITIFCDPENQPALTESFMLWFEDDEWDHVVYRGHGLSGKGGIAFITLEWEGCYIDALFIQQLRKEEGVLDYVIYIREGEA